MLVQKSRSSYVRLEISAPGSVVSRSLFILISQKARSMPASTFVSGCGRYEDRRRMHHVTRVTGLIGNIARCATAEVASECNLKTPEA